MALLLTESDPAGADARYLRHDSARYRRRLICTPRLYTVTRFGDTCGMPVPYEELSSPARIVFFASVGAFSAGELLQALRLRHGATRVDVRAEAAFRMMFFGGILMLPLGRAVVPGAVIGGGV
jgi:hypothetical protein